MIGQRWGRGLRALVAALVLVLVASGLAMPAAEASRSDDAVVVANRGSGDISVISTRTLSVQNYALPAGGEPMYVNHDRRNDRVYVGDRANSTIVVFDDKWYDVTATIDVGEGVFHQWHDARSRQLWVVGDIAQTVSVIDTDSLAVEATIDIPADLVARGGKPHDVFVQGRRAFVSILGVDGDTGIVLQYSTRDFAETGRIITGDDPHLFVQGNRLYVASQDASSVSRYNVRTLAPTGEIAVPNAHGIYLTNRGEVLVTNIAGQGSDGVFELNRRLTKSRAMADTLPVPHNLTVDRNRQAWVTHSGATANQVSVVDLERRGFGATAVVTVGTNPFGLAFVRG